MPHQSLVLPIRNTEHGPEILIYDEIGPDWAGYCSAISVKNALGKLSSEREVTVRINSPGGDVFEGFAIYNSFLSFPGVVNMHVDALAASAASVVAMAGKRIHMAANSMMMIHNCWCMVAGNAEELRRQATLCDKVDGQIVDTYAARTNLDKQKLIGMLAAETWLTANEAIELGFADEIGQALNVSACCSPRLGYRNVPEKFRPRPGNARHESIADVGFISANTARRFRSRAPAVTPIRAEDSSISLGLRELCQSVTGEDLTEASIDGNDLTLFYGTPEVPATDPTEVDPPANVITVKVDLQVDEFNERLAEVNAKLVRLEESAVKPTPAPATKNRRRAIEARLAAVRARSR